MNNDQSPTLGVAQTERQRDDGLWKTADVAAYLKVGVSTARRYVEKHGLPYLRIGGAVRYDPEAVKAWALNRPADAAA